MPPIQALAGQQLKLLFPFPVPLNVPAVKNLTSVLMPWLPMHLQASALDRFMSGTYTPGALGSGASGNALTRAALAAVGGNVTSTDFAGQYERYGLEMDQGEAGRRG